MSTLNNIERNKLENLLVNCAQILDVIKQEWAAENCWSEWDQSVRDELSRQLLRLYDEDKNWIGEPDTSNA